MVDPIRVWGLENRHNKESMSKVTTKQRKFRLFDTWSYSRNEIYELG